MTTKTARTGVKGLILVAFALWTVIPILMVVLTSFKKQKDIFTVPVKWLFVPTLDNYGKAFANGDFGAYFLNSAVVAAVSSLLSVGLGALCAYGLTAFGIRSAGLLTNFFMLGKLVPAVTMLLPLFVMIHAAGLLGTYVGPVLAHTAVNLPFVVWLAISFLKDVPPELEQAAQIDGCSKMQAFWRIVMPVILPGLTAAFILSMQYSWNELVFSLQLTNMDTYTLPVGISRFVGSVSVDWGKSSAAATMTMMPIIVIGFFIQKYLAEGTTGGAVKG
ncbi:carbohydrate ABC transporter permease [Cohnella nanjingensis]|uniref:Carbohydrate ABC transporter permease n=1 Tax=Cohnella nanjingensis TaxID=1387779 RepID=A0A7X0RNR3_9BACL|nr:carbohydrate ABC transporter permease [Cohnella nanjingensis]MBB6669454.1 carbohydrate ABC transporter permease [Cohnella nanjingensis]